MKDKLMDTSKKFVVLENLTEGYEGSRFWSTNDGTDPTKSAKGETWYKVIAYTNDPEEAKRLCKETDTRNHQCFVNAMFKHL